MASYGLKSWYDAKRDGINIMLDSRAFRMMHHHGKNVTRAAYFIISDCYRCFHLKIARGLAARCLKLTVWSQRILRERRFSPEGLRCLDTHTRAQAQRTINFMKN